MPRLVRLRGQTVVSDNPQPITDTPQGMQGPDGSTLVSLYAYPDYFNLQDEDNVNTYSLDLATPNLFGQDDFSNAVANALPSIVAHGEDLLCYGVYQYTIASLSIPDTISLGGQTFTPPFAGDTVASLLGYHIVVYTQTTQAAAAMAIMRPRPQGPLTIIAIAIAFLIVLAGIVAVIELVEGNLTWKDLSGFTKDIITAPGQVVSGALTGPLIALGFVLVASSIVLPIAISKLSVQVPVGGGSLGVSTEVGSAGGGRAPRR
jgi:hypothetical protein